MKSELTWLSNPEVFQIRRQEAHSDHKFYVNGKSTKVSLNGKWKFCYSENPASRPEDFYKKEYDCSGFDEIQVPGHIQLQGYDRRQYINTMYPWDGREFLRPPHISEKENPVGSYVTCFQLEEEPEETLYLSFQGVETAFYVWINGEFVGYSEDTFTPSEFDITKLCHKGENKLAVEVYKRSSASWIEDQDFWRFSGIFRDVYLYRVPALHMRDLSVRAELKNQYRDGEFIADMEFEGAKEGCVKAFLMDMEGDAVWNGEGEIRDGVLSLSGTLPMVHPWSGESPYLYTFFAEVYSTDGKIMEAVSQKVGFRTFEMKEGIMCLNGKRIIFRGINRHEFSAHRGRSITEEEMLWDIRFMKQHNINAVRTCHYPDQSRWYELCDEYGIYLIDEMNLESHGSWQKLGKVEPSWNVPGSYPEWKGCVLDRAKSMVERDKNHPSILIWSCGNESYAGDVLQAVSDYFHEKDDTRLVHYEGVFHNRAYDAISDMESRMYAKPEKIREYLEQETGKPYISCEYMHAMGNSLGGMKLYTDLEDEFDGYQGGFIWDYIDQALYQTLEDGREVLAYGGDFDERATDYCFCTNGIVFADRTISPKAQEVKALYANIRITLKEDQITVENRNLFVGTDDLDFVIRLEKEGILQSERTVKIAAAPGTKKVLPLEMEVPEAPGEYVITVSACLSEDTLWALKGHEIAFGQAVYQREVEKEPVGGSKPEVIYGDINIGVRAGKIFAMFSRQEGGMISLVSEGKEYITRPPRVSFWRATTDNDKGMNAAFANSQWLAASMCQRHLGEEFAVRETEDGVTITFVHEMGSAPTFRVKSKYHIEKDGTMYVSVFYPGVKELPSMPVFALDFKCKKELSQVTYYGNGPEETYLDRKNGGKLGIYQTTPQESCTPYLIPQECGNRTDVRWLKVCGEMGGGLLFERAEQDLSCSVLPYSTYELENAQHIYELPESHFTWVRLTAAQMGVGGDDSWGAPVHEQYQIDASKPMKLEFTIRCI